MKKYDEICSLGYNCEVSFRIEDYIGKIDAMPFSWSFIMDRSKFPSVIRNIDDLFSSTFTLMDDHMIRCDKCDIKFHPRYEILPKKGSYTQAQYDEALAELCKRVEHLKEKFKALCKSEKKTLFIMKVQSETEDDDYAYIKDVYNALCESYESQNFDLAVVMLEKETGEKIKSLDGYSAEESTAGIKIFTVKKYASLKHTNIMGDTRAWEKILYELTGEKSKRFKKSLRKRRIEWSIDVFNRRVLHK